MRKVEKVLWLLVVLAIFLILGVNGYFFWQKKNIEKDIQKADKQITTLISRIDELKAKKASIPKLQAFFESLDEKLLLQKEAKAYLNLISNTLDKNGISYTLKIQSVEKVADGYEIVYPSFSFISPKYSAFLNVLHTVESVDKWSQLYAPPNIKQTDAGYSVSFSIILPYVTDIPDTLWDIK